MPSRATTFSHIAIEAALVGALALAFAGCSGEAPPPPREIVVSVVTVGTQSVTLTSELTGRTVPYRIAEIRPQVNGIIRERLFEEGSLVKKGQTLYQIAPEPYQAALAGALAAEARAEANLTAIQLRKDRIEKLLPDHAVSQQDYDDAVAGLKQAEAEVKSWQAQVEAARINLGYTKVSAPISGRIGRSKVTVGAVVTAYQPMYLATIQQLDPIYVDMPQSTTEVSRLRRQLADGSLNQAKTQDRVRLVTDDGAAYPLTGVLQFTDVSVDPTTGSVMLRAVFPNPDGTLLPEMFVHAVVTEGVNRQAILIPQQGVARDPKGEPFAWIVDQKGQTQYRSLVLDRAIGDQWLVSKGLVPGDQLIVEGLQSLRHPGTPVKAVPFVPNAGPGDQQGAAPGGTDAQDHQQTPQPE